MRNTCTQRNFFPYLATTLLTFTLLQPMVLHAQESPDLGYLESAILSVGDLVNQLIPIAISIGLLLFIWGIVQFIANSGDEDAKEVGKRRMVWGILALFVIVSVWGLVDLLSQIVGVDTGGEVEVPQVPSS